MAITQRSSRTFRPLHRSTHLLTQPAPARRTPLVFSLFCVAILLSQGITAAQESKETIPPETSNAVAKEAQQAGTQDTGSQDTGALETAAEKATRPAVAGQDGTPDKPADDVADWAQLESAELLTSAYDATNSAVSEADYAEILAKCVELRSRDLVEAEQQHAIRLTAWANYHLAERLMDRSSLEFKAAQSALQAIANVTEERQAEYDAKVTAANELTRKAIDLLTACYEDDPTRLEAKFSLGVAQAMLGDYAAAEALFGFVVEANPQHAEAHFNRAECLSALDQIDAAIASYTKALELRPQDPAGYTGRGHAYLKQGTPAKALLDYKRCVQMQPNNARALVNRGDAFLQLGKWEEALTDYMMARGEAPSLSVPCQRMAWVMATSPELKLRNERAAYDLAIEAIKLNGQADAKLMDTLAATQAAIGWFEDAQTTLLQIKEIDPEAFDDEKSSRLKLYQAERPFVQPKTIR